MKNCPYCAEAIQDSATKCRYCGSSLGGSPLMREWYRRRRGKKIAGVCAGLAEEFGISTTPLRLAFIQLTLIGGPGIVLYVIFAAQMFGPEIPGWVYYATIGAGVGVLILRRRARIERERLAMENMLEPPPPPCPHGEFYIQQLKERG